MPKCLRRFWCWATKAHDRLKPDHGAVLDWYECPRCGAFWHKLRGL